MATFVSKRHRVLVENPHLSSLAARVLLRAKLRAETTSEWLTFREDWLSKRDLTCHYCGKPNLLVETSSRSMLATIDHVIPRSKGGAEYDDSNLVVACYPCNSKKADSLCTVVSTQV